jgi:hypothetical protein
MKKPLARMCVACGQPFESIPSQVSRGLAKFCTRSCARTAENNPNWKGGITLTKNGYRGVWNGKSYDLEHRLVMEEILGRPLLDEEVVHHKDEDKLNNHPDNLEVMTRSEHTTHHMKGNSYARKG